jgi:hypothetical protein
MQDQIISVSQVLSSIKSHGQYVWFGHQPYLQVLDQEVFHILLVPLLYSVSKRISFAYTDSIGAWKTSYIRSDYK